MMMILMIIFVLKGLIHHFGASQYAQLTARDIHWVIIIFIVIYHAHYYHHDHDADFQNGYSAKVTLTLSSRSSPAANLSPMPSASRSWDQRS